MTSARSWSRRPGTSRPQSNREGSSASDGEAPDPDGPIWRPWPPGGVGPRQQPRRTRNGSATTSTVSASSPRAIASVDRPTGPPLNLRPPLRARLGRAGPDRARPLRRAQARSGQYPGSSCRRPGPRRSHRPGAAAGSRSAAPARPGGQLRRSLVGERHPEQPGRPADDALELVRPRSPGGRRSRTCPQRSRQQPGPGGRPDQRDAAMSSGIAVAPGPLPITTSTRKSSMARQSISSGGRARRVDLVDEDHLALAERGQDGGQVTRPLDRRAAGDRSGAPSSAATIIAIAVLPSPVGPDSSTWSVAGRAQARCRISDSAAHLAGPTNSLSRLGRSAPSMSRSSASAAWRRTLPPRRRSLVGLWTSPARGELGFFGLAAGPVLGGHRYCLLSLRRAARNTVATSTASPSQPPIVPSSSRPRWPGRLRGPAQPRFTRPDHLVPPGPACWRPRGRPSPPSLGGPSLSFISSTICCAPFRPMPGTMVSAPSSSAEMARRSASGACTASMGQGQPRPDAAGRLQHLEDVPLVVRAEAEQGQRVLPDDQGSGHLAGSPG